MLKVKWDENVCIHSGVCVKSLPKVFKIEDSQFVIDASAAADDEVREVVKKCPSGALTVEE